MQGFCIRQTEDEAFHIGVYGRPGTYMECLVRLK
jgi:hypothetical protein